MNVSKVFKRRKGRRFLTVEVLTGYVIESISEHHAIVSKKIDRWGRKYIVIDLNELQTSSYHFRIEVWNADHTDSDRVELKIGYLNNKLYIQGMSRGRAYNTTQGYYYHYSSSYTAKWNPYSQEWESGKVPIGEHR